MDRFKFRGRRVDGGEWVIGSHYFHFVEEKETLLIGYSHITYRKADFIRTYEYNDFDEIVSCCDIEVDPATIGQCTGLRDKNGKLIFEGDIIKHNYAIEDDVEYYEAVYYEDLLKWQFETLDRKAFYGVGLSVPDSVDIEIIGTIHDSPELLKA